MNIILVRIAKVYLVFGEIIRMASGYKCDCYAACKNYFFHGHIILDSAVE